MQNAKPRTAPRRGGASREARRPSIAPYRHAARGGAARGGKQSRAPRWRAVTGEGARATGKLELSLGIGEEEAGDDFRDIGIVDAAVEEFGAGTVGVDGDGGLGMRLCRRIDNRVCVIGTADRIEAAGFVVGGHEDERAGMGGSEIDGGLDEPIGSDRSEDGFVHIASMSAFIREAAFEHHEEAVRVLGEVCESRLHQVLVLDGRELVEVVFGDDAEEFRTGFRGCDECFGRLCERISFALQIFDDIQAIEGTVVVERCASVVVGEEDVESGLRQIGEDFIAHISIALMRIEGGGGCTGEVVVGQDSDGEIPFFGERCDGFERVSIRIHADMAVVGFMAGGESRTGCGGVGYAGIGGAGTDDARVGEFFEEKGCFGAIGPESGEADAAESHSITDDIDDMPHAIAVGGGRRGFGFRSLPDFGGDGGGFGQIGRKAVRRGCRKEGFCRSDGGHCGGAEEEKRATERRFQGLFHIGEEKRV